MHHQSLLIDQTNNKMSKKIGEKKETLKEQDLKKIEQMREAKKRKKELK